MTKIIVHGASGKMGSQVIVASKSFDEVEVICGIDTYITGESAIKIYPTPFDCAEKADVIIDFSNHSAVHDILKYALETKTPIVVCTTGLDDSTLRFMHEVSREVPVLYSANMSLGVNVLIELAKKASRVFSANGFDIEIMEKHHNQKLDSPSGTALAIANAINEVNENSFEYIYDRTKEKKKRGKKELGISAIRGGNIVGEHEVFFIGEDEVVSITHRARSKRIFANGAINAAVYLANKEPGLYKMADLLGDK